MRAVCLHIEKVDVMSRIHHGSKLFCQHYCLPFAYASVVFCSLARFPSELPPLLASAIWIQFGNYLQISKAVKFDMADFRDNSKQTHKCKRCARTHTEGSNSPRPHCKPNKIVEKYRKQNPHVLCRASAQLCRQQTCQKEIFTEADDHG